MQCGFEKIWVFNKPTVRVPYSNNSFLLSSFLQSSSQTRYLRVHFVSGLLRNGASKRIQIWKRHTTKCCPQSQTRKRLDLAFELAGVDSLPDAAHNVRRSTSAYKQSAKCREAQTRISQHKTHNRTHARTNTASQQKLDGPHKARDVSSTSHKCQVWHEQRAKVCHHIDRDWIHFDNVLSVAKNTFENADKFVIEDSFFCTKTTISLFDTPSICT